MATKAQIHANRENAKKSTGPRTDEGKASASRNAPKHGLLARDPVRPGEDPAEFDRPANSLEFELVRQIADAQWRMRRLARLETGYLAACLDETGRFKNRCEPETLQPGYHGETLLLGSAMLQRTQELLHLARYDAHLSRRFHQAIRQIAALRDAQEKREQKRGRSASPATAPTPDQPHQRPNAPSIRATETRITEQRTRAPAPPPEPGPTAAVPHHPAAPAHASRLTAHVVPLPVLPSLRLPDQRRHIITEQQVPNEADFVQTTCNQRVTGQSCGRKSAVARPGAARLRSQLLRFDSATTTGATQTRIGCKGKNSPTAGGQNGTKCAAIVISPLESTGLNHLLGARMPACGPFRSRLPHEDPRSCQPVKWMVFRDMELSLCSALALWINHGR